MNSSDDGLEGSTGLLAEPAQERGSKLRRGTALAARPERVLVEQRDAFDWSQPMSAWRRFSRRRTGLSIGRRPRWSRVSSRATSARRLLSCHIRSSLTSST